MQFDETTSALVFSFPLLPPSFYNVDIMMMSLAVKKKNRSQL
jgi:hypothetical protein